MLTSEAVDSCTVRSLMGGLNVKMLSATGLMWCLPILLVLKSSMGKEIVSREYLNMHFLIQAPTTTFFVKHTH